MEIVRKASLHLTHPILTYEDKSPAHYLPLQCLGPLGGDPPAVGDTAARGLAPDQLQVAHPDDK